MAHRIIQVMLDTTLPALDSTKRFWKLALFDDQGDPIELGGDVGASVGAKVTKNAPQTIPNVSGSDVVLTWDTEVIDDADFHDNSTNNSRLTAPSDGWYQVLAQVAFAGDSDGYRHVAIVANGTDTVGLNRSRISSADQTITQTHALVYLEADEYVEVAVWHDAGNNLDVVVNNSHFSIVKV